jgi:hypothetical protein
MKSLELNWIRRKVDKTIPIPEVMFFPFGDGRAGSYCDPDPHNEVFDIDGKPYSMKYGIIIVGSKFGKDEQKNIIAHEWRHHWQYFNGMKHAKSKYRATQITQKNYNHAVKQYFSTSKSELDALRFSYLQAGFLGKYEPWEELLYDLIKDLRTKPIITYGNNTFNDQPKIQSCSSIIRHSYSFDKKTRRV